MKNSLKIIADCQAIGVFLSLSNGNINITSCHEGLPTEWPNVLEQLKAHKMDVMEQLAALEERAAVLEYEGGLTRSQAEQQAFEELKHTNVLVGSESDQIEQWHGSIAALPSHFMGGYP